MSAPAGAPVTGLEIAVIGMAGRFPGAGDLEAFWRNLRDGVESISTFSDEELAAAGVDPDVMRDPAYVRAGGIVEGVEPPELAADFPISVAIVLPDRTAASLIGDVELGTDSSIWYGSVLRGDINSIYIGARTNIQDNCTIHVTHEAWATVIAQAVALGIVALGAWGIL